MELGPYLTFDEIDYECTLCERVFASKGSLYAHCRNTSRDEWCERCCRHQRKHQPRTMECCGCYKTFKSFSGVLIHLESGGCSSNITEDEIGNFARECYQSRKYINDELEEQRLKSVARFPWMD
ncbi:hypothetical protein BDV23DRAFT_174102 [Aspergillus alliaceus]|uniref:C2H2-type domain-containing protein n=1 Tax=Petromyces alliaceus TaxID=209559 RepID=A0A5N7C254_PETAA|nr:hypothetical protein BDV23DRAFT_174102 [Aspergillus alliaceus]